MPVRSVDPCVDEWRQQSAVEDDAHHDAREERDGDLDRAHRATVPRGASLVRSCSTRPNAPTGGGHMWTRAARSRRTLRRSLSPAGSCLLGSSRFKYSLEGAEAAFHVSSQGGCQ
jgi:hypothetical protein